MVNMSAASGRRWEGVTSDVDMEKGNAHSLKDARPYPLGARLAEVGGLGREQAVWRKK